MNQFESFVAEVPQIDPEADSSKYMLYTLSVSEQ